MLSGATGTATNPHNGNCNKSTQQQQINADRANEKISRMGVSRQQDSPEKTATILILPRAAQFVQLDAVVHAVSD
jgi:hypothetical protein